MAARFDVFTRNEIHFLRDVISFYRLYCADHANVPPAGDEELGKRLIAEMHRSMKQRSEATR